MKIYTCNPTVNKMRPTILERYKLNISTCYCIDILDPNSKREEHSGIAAINWLQFSCYPNWCKVTLSFQYIYSLRYTLNSEFFGRVLFSRNFADAKFSENKTSSDITLSSTGVD